MKLSKTYKNLIITDYQLVKIIKIVILILATARFLFRGATQQSLLSQDFDEYKPFSGILGLLQK